MSAYYYKNVICLGMVCLLLVDFVKISVQNFFDRLGDFVYF